MAGLSRVKWDAEDKNSALPPLPSTAGAKVETPTAGESVAEQAASLGDVTDIYGGGDEDEDTYVDIGTLLDLDLGDDSDVDVDEEESDDVFLNRQGRGPWISPHGMHASCIPSGTIAALHCATSYAHTTQFSEIDDSFCVHMYERDVRLAPAPKHACMHAATSLRMAILS